MHFEHFLLTRFNIRLPWTDVERTEQWLRHRIRMFEAYCYPSVTSQASQNFKWLLFFDSQSPDYLRERVEHYRRWPGLIPVFTGTFNSRICSQAVLRHLGPRPDCLVTTRLDSDDALCRDFTAMIQQRVDCRERHWINFLKGYLLLEERLLTIRKPSNQFITMVEPCGDREGREIKTAFCGLTHAASSELAPVVDVDGDPSWLWVYHGNNISRKYHRSRSDVQDDPKAEERFFEDFVVHPTVSIEGREEG